MISSDMIVGAIFMTGVVTLLPNKNTTRLTLWQIFMSLTAKLTVKPEESTLQAQRELSSLCNHFHIPKFHINACKFLHLPNRR